MPYRSRVQHGDLAIVTNLWSHKHSHFRTFLFLSGLLTFPPSCQAQIAADLLSVLKISFPVHFV